VTDYYGVGGAPGLLGSIFGTHQGATPKNLEKLKAASKAYEEARIEN
jgi:hypothetical protein